MGLVDEPTRMRRRPWLLDVGAGTSLSVVGTGRSGRTGALVAAAASAATASPADVHVYAVEGAGSGLAGLEQLPHCGALVAVDESERLARLLRRLAAEVTRRRRQPARTATDAGLLLLVDGWEAVHRQLEETEHGQPLDDLLQVAREGPAVGVSTVVCGDRSLLTGRLGGVFAQRLLLRTADPTDALLAGVPPAQLPREMPAGRGVLVGADGTVEVQVVAPADLAVVASAATARWAHVSPERLPFRVEAMPRRCEESALLAGGGAAGRLLLGIGGEDVSPLGWSPAEARSAVVAGPAGSGRSTALAAVGAALRRAGEPAAAICPRPSPLPDLLPDVPVLTAEDAAEHLAAHPETVVLLDDADTVEGTPLEQLLLAHLTAGLRGGVVLAGTSAGLGSRFRGLAAEVRRARTGVLLSPTGYADGDVLGVQVSRTARVQPGRGFLVTAGDVRRIQIAVPSPARAVATAC